MKFYTYILLVLLLGGATVDCAPTTPNVCALPLESGNCYALFWKFGFDSAKGKCVKFIYGGCQGNSNRFDTEQECRKACTSHC